MGNWDEATREKIEAVIQALECPHCQAFNKIGASDTIEVVNGFAVCWSCAKTWVVKSVPSAKPAKKSSAA